MPDEQKCQGTIIREQLPKTMVPGPEQGTITDGGLCRVPFGDITDYGLCSLPQSVRSRFFRSKTNTPSRRWRRDKTRRSRN